IPVRAEARPARPVRVSLAELRRGRDWARRDPPRRAASPASRGRDSIRGVTPMPVKVKSVLIQDDPKDPRTFGVVNRRDASGLRPAEKFSTMVVGGNVEALNVVLELDANGGPGAELPGRVTVEVRSYEPGRRLPGKGSLPAPFLMPLDREAGGPLYK